MTSREASPKIKLRLEKLDSNDYDNLTQHQLEEAVNKAALEFVREKKKLSDDQTGFDVDDLQILVKEKGLSKVERDTYVLTASLPDDYLFLKRVTPKCNKGLCENVYIKSTLVEEANVDELLQDYNSQPSFDFEETFHTLSGDKIKVFHNNDFSIEEVKLTYYRRPQRISFDRNTNTKEWEWKEDVAEHIIDRAVRILAADTANQSVYQTSSQTIVNNK